MKKRIFCLTSIILLLSVLLNVAAAASETGEGWYLVKHIGAAPDFSPRYEFLKKHGCYAIDEVASKSGDKVVYLTFDAGYENGNVKKILDTLKIKGVNAAFFVLTNIIRKNSELINRMADEGHLVCNHTSNHKNLTKLTKDEIIANLERLETQYKETTGRDMPKYFRYPEGYYSNDTALICEEAGYKTFFWSMAYADWDNRKQPSKSAALDVLIKNVHPGAVLLLHPTSDTNAEIMGELIDAFRSMGYRFGTLDELVERQGAAT